MMLSKPIPIDPELVKLLQMAKDWWATATEAEKEEMLRKQREGYVRAEMAWPRDCPYR